MKNERRINLQRSRWALPLLLMVMLVAAACDTGGSAPPTAIGGGGATSAGTPPTKQAAGGTARPTTGSKPTGKLDCQAIVNALVDLETNQTYLTAFVAGGGSVVNRPDSPFYVNTATVRSDLNVLAALPDPTNPVEASMLGKPSDAILQFRQLLDIVDKNSQADAAGTPAATSTPGTTTDQQLLDYTVKLVKMYGSLGVAEGNSCPGYTATPPAGLQTSPQATSPAGGQTVPQAAPLKASYTIGQTAPVGALRVTLNKITAPAGSGSILPTAGNRFLLVYLTVENTGKVPFGINTLLETYFQDAAGKQYFADPFSGALDTEATNNLSSQIEPGAKPSGAIGFQVPRDAGDLVFVFKDFKPTLAVFGVKASDVVAVGTPVTEAGADAMRAGAAATQTAFVGSVFSVATADAAITETPVLPEPTETAAPPVPTDTAAPMDIPAPTDTSAPIEDTPTAGP